MAGNSALNKAAQAKQDEFYTQLSDIEKELRHYKEHLRGKIIFCNCDDPFESNFFKYFAMKFNSLGLKKLIATCYASSPFVYTQLNLFGDDIPMGTEPGTKKPYKIEITEVNDENGDGAVDLADVEYLLRNHKNTLTLLQGNGDFRSEECVELLKEADIVVTNPPFSLFREYVAQLVKYDKKFLIIGNQNAISYKDIFQFFKMDQIWMGYHCGDMAFRVPDYFEPRETRYWQDENGQKWRSMGNIAWFTNLDVKKRHEELILYKKYTPEEYPKYANYDAIEVSKTADIPCDYYGEMGVPITFLDKYNPEQFEIIGSSRWLGRPMSEIAPKGSYVSGGVRFYLPIDKNSQTSDNFDSTAQHSTAQHSTAQHSTAQHSTAQHSTAQHSTAQHSTSYTAASTTESLSSGVRYQRLYDRIVIKRRMG